MKHKRVASCAFTVVCLLQIGSAMSKPDFSGAWVLDKNRSFSNPPGLEQTLNIAHWLPDGRRILISDEITSDSPNGPRKPEDHAQVDSFERRWHSDG
jgi:hypothetical protein